MRRPIKNPHVVAPDAKYGSVRVEKFINSVMWDGKKSVARKVVYDALDIVKEKTKVENPVEIFETAIRNVGPAMEIRSRRVGGANYQVPREVRPERKMHSHSVGSLSLRAVARASLWPRSWLLKSLQHQTTKASPLRKRRYAPHGRVQQSLRTLRVVISS